MPGRGTVATGTARAGRVRLGDTLAIMPAGTPVRVRSIHAQNVDCEIGRAGQRCALNLAGIDKTALTRGDWLADPRALAPSARLDVRLRWLRDGAPLANRAPLHVHIGTAHRVAQVVLLEADELTAGEATFAQFVFERPVCSAAGDVFIVRDAQARNTVGGGVVIDPVGPRGVAAVRIDWPIWRPFRTCSRAGESCRCSRMRRSASRCGNSCC